MINRIFFIFVCSTFGWACSSQHKAVHDTATTTLNSSSDKEKPSAHYRVLEPQIDPKSDFDHAQKVVKRIQTTTYYTTYYFDASQRVTPDVLRFQKAEKLSRSKLEFSNSKTGSSISLQRNDTHLVLITCDHVVHVEDTVLVYQDGLKAAKNAPLKSVSILNKVEYLVFDAPKLSSFSVLSRNKADDLALIKTELPDERTEPFTVETLKMNLGNEKWMQWGSIVYALGYPMGYKMLTKGLISDPDKESNFYTLSDIQFNPGISGGLVMSIRGDTHAFEWIGMASSASSTVEYVLRPRENALNEKEDFQVYTDTLFVQRKVAVNQGITRSIKASSIRRFLDESASILSANGFDLTTFYSLANNPK